MQAFESNIIYKFNIDAELNETFGHNVDLLTEEVEATLILDSKAHNFIKKVLKLAFKVASLTLVPNESYSCLNTVKFFNPLNGISKFIKFHQQQDGRLSPAGIPFDTSRGRLISLLTILLFAFMTLKWIPVGFLQFLNDWYSMAFDNSIKSFSLSNDVNGTKNCIQHEDIYRNEKLIVLEEHLKMIKKLLNYLGNPIVSISGATACWYSIVGSVPILFFFTGLIFFEKNEIRVDILAYVFDHFNERLRLRNEIVETIMKMIESFSDYGKYLERKESRGEHLHLIETNNFGCFANLKTQRHFDDLKIRLRHKQCRHLFIEHIPEETIYAASSLNPPTIKSNRITSSSPNLIIKNSSMNKQKLIANTESYQISSKTNNIYRSILHDVNLVDFVRPANLGTKFHKSVIDFNYIFLKLAISFTVMIVLVMLTILIIMEINERVKHRLIIIECLKWRHSAIPSVDYHLKLPSITFSGDEKVFSNYNGTLSSFIDMFSIELKYYFDRRNIFLLLEMFVLLVPTTFIVGFYFIIYGQTFTNKQVWVNQIQKQVKYCIRLLKLRKSILLSREMRKLTSEISTNEQVRACYLFGYRYIGTITTTTSDTTDDYLDSHDYKLIKALTITYLNFELFRRQQKSYQKLVNFLLFQMSILIGETLAFCYAIGTIIENCYISFLLILATYMFMFINFYLISGAMRMSQMERLIKNIVELLAGATSNSMQLLHILDLWRRQLLDERGARQTFSSKFFGICISYDKILTLNGYLVALWFVLLLVTR